MTDIGDICDYCLDEERDCMMCPLGNPCLDCEDYDKVKGICKSNGGCAQEGRTKVAAVNVHFLNDMGGAKMLQNGAANNPSAVRNISQHELIFHCNSRESEVCNGCDCRNECAVFTMKYGIIPYQLQNTKYDINKSILEDK